MPKKSHINTSDLQGFTRMITDATVGVTDLVEALHRRIVHPPHLPSTPIQQLITGISSIAYTNVKLATKLIGAGLDKALGQLKPMLDQGVSSDQREAIIAALNGVLGDYLENNQNPLSIPMQFRHQGKTIALNEDSIKSAYSNVNGKILLMVHGLCMNDIQWNRNDHEHGTALANALDLTPVYLYYNSGRHISTNGQNLNALLEQLVNHWPVPIEQLVIVAHSMGGLVTRSTFHYGKVEKNSWTKHLRKIVFLGTPHHGAPMERAGNYVDLLLEATPYAKPFARLGKIRSAGITDLRYGNLVDEDWEETDRFEKKPDKRKPISLPEEVACYTIAATTGKKSGDWSDRLLADGIVPVKSALGQHKNPDKNLSFKESRTWIINESSHMDLLSSPKVCDKIKTWLSE